MSRHFPCCGWRAKRGRPVETAPCVFNAANEVAVAAFLESRLSFLGIAEVVEAALTWSEATPARDLDDLLEADRSARVLADERLAVA